MERSRTINRYCFNSHGVPSILLVLAVCIFVLVNTSARAQTKSDTLHFTTDTLLVESVRSTLSSEKAPFSVSIQLRSQQDILTNAAHTLSSITSELPGIWVNDRQTSALGERITLRGLGWRAAFGVRGIQVILNGIPLTVADGQSVTNIIEPALITRAELIRGPAGSYWGNSSGGVLYLSTDAGAANQPFLVRMQAGSYGIKKGLIQYSQNEGKHSFSTFTSYQFDKGYRNYSASKILRSGVQGSYQTNGHGRLEYSGALLFMPQAEHPSGLTAQQVDDNPRQANDAFINAEAGKQVTQGQLGLSYYSDTQAGLMTFTGYGVYRDLSNPLPFGIITVDRWAGGLRGTLETSYNRFKTNVGAELKLQHDDRREFENMGGSQGSATVDQAETVWNQAVFLHSTYDLQAINLSASLRFDRINFSSDSTGGNNTLERSFNALSPGFGVSYTTGPSTLYANVSTSFEAPTTTELVNRPDGGNGFNPHLKPERTLGLEAGSRGSILQQKLTYDVAVYKLWITDLLFPYQLELNGPVYYRNQGETHHSGIEITSTLQATPSFSIDATYTLTRAMFRKAQTLDETSLAGNRVPGVPRHRLNGSFTWNRAALRIQIGGSYVSSYPVNNENTVYNDDYIIVNSKLSLATAFRKMDIGIIPFLNLNNIFDKQYSGSTVVNAFGGRYFEPAPGRNWQAGFSMTF